MASWTHILRFTAAEDGKAYYAKCDSALPQIGAQVASFTTITSLDIDSATTSLKTIKEVCADGHYLLQI